jgi:mono/diheme cytochrome c family protein
MARCFLALSGVLFATGVGLSNPAEGADPATAWSEPEVVYTAACAACHGPGGRGRPQEVVGFETELPDLTDCNFATREPDPDWFAIAHQGGPVRGFDHRMPAFGQALSEAQIEAAVAHIRTFCAGQGWPSGNLNLPRPMFTEKAFVEDEAILTVGVAVERPKAIDAELLYEARFGKRSQLELVIPFGAAEQLATDEDPSAGGWVGGIGDVALGVKHVFVAAPPAGFIFSGILELILPTGDESEGLGGGIVVLEPALAFGQSLGPAGFLHLQAGAEIPLEQGPEVEAFWRVVYGYTFTQGPFGRAWSPMLEMLGSAALEEGAKAHWDLAPQIQISLNTRQHVALGLAARIPLEPGHDRPIGVWAYLLWEWFDGGLTEGW